MLVFACLLSWASATWDDIGQDFAALCIRGPFSSCLEWDTMTSIAVENKLRECLGITRTRSAAMASCAWFQSSAGVIARQDLLWCSVVAETGQLTDAEREGPRAKISHSPPTTRRVVLRRRTLQEHQAKGEAAVSDRNLQMRGATSTACYAQCWHKCSSNNSFLVLFVSNNDNLEAL